MNSNAIQNSVNTQMVESIIQLIHSLPRAERELLEQRLAEELPELTTQDLMYLADKGGSFNFWHDEPDIYTFEDGEPIQW
jgi:Tfp pilus assembly pilus retraction ATPase PilT